MAITTHRETVNSFQFPDADTEDLRSFFERICNYRKPAGFGKDDGLNLTKRDKEIAKQFLSGFVLKEEE